MINKMAIFAFAVLLAGTSYAVAPVDVDCNVCGGSGFDCNASHDDADNFTWSWQPAEWGTFQLSGPFNDVMHYTCDTGEGTYGVLMKAFGYDNQQFVGAGQDTFTCNP